MTQKIFRSTMLVAAAVLLSSLGIVIGALYSYFTNIQVAQLKDELSLAVTGTEQYGNAFLQNVEGDRFRITWVAPDGAVLMDTKVSTDALDNHADREEIREALACSTGSSSRYSNTLLEKTFYEAAKLYDGTILRISASQASVGALVLGMLRPIALVAVIAIILSALLADRIARKIVEPINALDLEHPLRNPAYAEISPLLQRINRQHIQIAAHIRTLKEKADEFEQITGNMTEGLVVLSSEGNILSINPTAKQLFNTESDCIGRNFLLVDRSREMRSAVNTALDRGHSTARTRRNGRDYQFDLSRIKSDGNVIGVVVLAFDITETLNAERNRREFSANVSHELKTPLQSIIGSAELLENGLVKPEDTPRFVGHIRKEAVRLVSLIEDIIRLSQLDEGASLPTEEVDMLALAEEIRFSLEASAAEKGVHLSVTGTGFTVSGVRRLLHEILYNLCDNAIKYNVPGGSVCVCVEGNKLTVRDTGIGIPAEHQSRVFERFYRVDKSHSKQSGGTGLGLSIVKHAVQHHNAQLEMTSIEGQGTTVSITF